MLFLPLYSIFIECLFLEDHRKKFSILVRSSILLDLDISKTSLTHSQSILFEQISIVGRTSKIKFTLFCMIKQYNMNLALLCKIQMESVSILLVNSPRFFRYLQILLDCSKSLSLSYYGKIDLLLTSFDSLWLYSAVNYLFYPNCSVNILVISSLVDLLPQHLTDQRRILGPDILSETVH